MRTGLKSVGDSDGRHFLAYSKWRRVVVEVTRCPPSMFNGFPLGRGGYVSFRLIEIDREGDIVNENRMAGSTDNGGHAFIVPCLAAMNEEWLDAYYGLIRRTVSPSRIQSLCVEKLNRFTYKLLK